MGCRKKNSSKIYKNKKNTNEIIVHLKKHSSTPRKMRLIANLIRNMQAEKALYLLKYNNNKVSLDISKLLLSALSIWKYNNKNIDDIYIKSIFVNESRTIKRFRPVPQGKSNKIRKRNNNLTISISSKRKLI